MNRNENNGIFVVNILIHNMKIYSRLLIIISVFIMTSVMSFGQEKVIFTPQWTAQSQFAGYYVALEKGFYKDAGLDVVFVHPSTSNSSINQIKNGHSDFVTMQLQQAMIQINEGVELVNILQTMQNSSLLIMPRHEDIKSIYDLKGKRVGIWKAGFGEYVRMIDKERNLDIEWVPFIQNINLFISGVIDATLATSYNEILQIRAAGYDISTAIKVADDKEFNLPEDGLYVTLDYYKNNPEIVKAFAEASRKGWVWVEENTEEALDIVMKVAYENQIATNRTLQKWMLEEVLRLNRDKETGVTTYELKEEDVNKLSELLVRHGAIQNTISYETITGKK